MKNNQHAMTNKNGTKTKRKVKRNIKKTNKENKLVDRETKKRILFEIKIKGFWS